MGIRVIVIGGAVVAIAVAVVVVTGFVVVQFGDDRSTSGTVASADVLVENQRLRSQNETLVQRNGRLSAENESLQARVNELQVEGAGQGNLQLELERVRGEYERARRDLAEESARREQVEDTLADLRVDAARGFGWPPFLVVTLLALAGLALWRELWWRRSTVLTETPPIRVVGEGTNAMTRRATDVPSTRTRA